jgi:4-amino-4-deoxy-L-arabinose transferase-like glycosyltransferase
MARLALILAGALAIRILYTLLVADDIPVIGDALTYHLLGENLAEGRGFERAPHPQLAPVEGWEPGVPTAEHPPLFPLLIGLLTKLGATGYLAQKLLLCMVGTATVAFVGLAGREAAGPAVGLVAAGLAAVYPFLWVVDGSLMSETLYGALLAATLWLAIRFARRPSLGLAAGLGALVALAALTRGEALLLVPLLLLPLAARAGAAWRSRLTLAAVAVGAFALVLAPWTIRNLTVFEEPVLISTNGNAVFVGSNCERVYHGAFTGLWSFDCYGSAPGGDESEASVVYRERGLEYARDHAGRVPVVMAVRLLRVWDLYRPLQQASYEQLEGRSVTASHLGLVMYYPLLLLAAAGAVILRRRRAPLWPLLAFPVMVSITAVAIYGVTRFRLAAEPALCLLAAVALAAAARTMKTRLTAGSSQSQSTAEWTSQTADAAAQPGSPARTSASTDPPRNSPRNSIPGSPSSVSVSIWIE